MIAHINGRLVEKSPTYVVIDCGGVGYKLNISLNTYSKLGEGESCKLFTEFIVREDAQLLYGFKDVSERRLFQLLISVSGIGPATALLVLSSADAEEIQQAILSGNFLNTFIEVKFKSKEHAISEDRQNRDEIRNAVDSLQCL